MKQNKSGDCLKIYPGKVIQMTQEEFDATKYKTPVNNEIEKFGSIALLLKFPQKNIDWMLAETINEIIEKYGKRISELEEELKLHLKHHDNKEWEDNGIVN